MMMMKKEQEKTRKSLYTDSNDLGHLAGFDRSVTVDVIHLERPLELLFRLSRRRDVDRLQKLFEVDLAAVVRVERAEHVLAELVGVALWKETRIDFQKLVARQLAVRTISLKHEHNAIFNSMTSAAFAKFLLDEESMSAYRLLSVNPSP